jgi:hypothetical protein
MVQNKLASFGMPGQGGTLLLIESEINLERY